MPLEIKIKFKARKENLSRNPDFDSEKAGQRQQPKAGSGKRGPGKSGSWKSGVKSWRGFPRSHTQLNVAILRVNIKVPGESFTGAQRFAFVRFSLAIKHLAKGHGTQDTERGTRNAERGNGCRKENEENTCKAWLGQSQIWWQFLCLFVEIFPPMRHKNRSRIGAEPRAAPEWFTTPAWILRQIYENIAIWLLLIYYSEAPRHR